MISRIFYIALLILVIARTPLHAQTPEEPVIDSRQVYVESLFGQQLTDHIAQQNEGKRRQILLDGDTKVEKIDNYYAITLPDLKVQYEGSEQTITTHIGRFAINMAPNKDSESLWKITLAVPTPIITRHGEEIETMVFKLGKQSFSGLWDQKEQTFTRLDLNYNDLHFEDPSQAQAASIDNITFRADLPQEEERISVSLSSSKIDVTPEEKQLRTVWPTDITFAAVIRPKDQENGKLPAPLTLLSDLFQQNVSIRLADNIIRNQYYDAVIDAALLIDPVAPLGYIGDIRLVLDGFDNVVSALEGLAASDDIKTAKAVQKLILSLKIIRGIAKKEPGEEAGETKDVFEISLQKDGPILLNGQNIAPLLELAQITSRADQKPKESVEAE